MKLVKIGFYGATGSYDFGDFAMMCVNLQALYEADPTAEFIIFTPSPSTTDDCLKRNIKNLELLQRIELVDDHFVPTDRNALEWFVRRATRKLLGYDSYFDKVWNNSVKVAQHGERLRSDAFEALSNCDVLVFNGGGYIQNGWFGNVKVFLAYILIASYMNIPIWFLGNSFGPLSEDFMSCASKALPLASGILVRDGLGYSLELLKKVGCSNYEVGTDDLMYALSPLAEERLVVIEFMAWIARHPRGADWAIDELSRFTHWLIDESYEVVFICFDKDDSFAIEGMKRICNECGNSPLITIVEDLVDIQAVFNPYERCCFSVSCKYHPVIFSLACSRPCLAFICDDDGYYEGKLNGAFESVGLSPSGRVLRLPDLSFEVLKESFLARSEQKLASPLKNSLKTSKSNYIKRIIDDAQQRSGLNGSK